MALAMRGCGVNGYTANTASALQLLMMAISVENSSDLMRRPITTMPLARKIASGTVTMCLRSSPVITGRACSMHSTS